MPNGPRKLRCQMRLKAKRLRGIWSSVTDQIDPTARVGGARIFWAVGTDEALDTGGTVTQGTKTGWTVTHGERGMGTSEGKHALRDWCR